MFDNDENQDHNYDDQCTLLIDPLDEWDIEMLEVLEPMFHER